MGLGEFIIRRTILMVPTLIGVVVLIFAVTQMFSPQQRAMLYVTSERQANQIDNIIRQYGLNESVFIQFTNWAAQVLQGNLGYSRTGGAPVLTVMLRKIPATFEIVMFSVPITILLGVYLGVQSAVNRDKPIDHVTRSLSIVGLSLPSFWLGIMLMAIFFSGLGWFPPERVGSQAFEYIYLSGNWRTYTSLLTIDGLLNGQPWITLDILKHLVLPTITLVTIQLAYLIRVMRSSMLESLSRGYVTAARAKGLSNTEVINKHARRNALIPTMTIAGLITAGLITGVTITETVFNIDGLGRWAAQAAGGAGGAIEVPSVLGFALFTGIVYVVANLIVDLLYAYVDPRIRLG